MAASFLRPSRFGQQDDIYLRKRFARHSRIGQLFAVAMLDVREMRTMEESIIQGDDGTVMSFKSSQTGAVGMTAVASAIIAQLSSTTLQLPALSNIDWTASALIITALLFSIVATLLSVILQQTLATLNDPAGFRMWLSNGSVRQSKSASNRILDREQLQTSVASLLLLRLPNFFLLCAVACFLIGFGLLLGFAWRQDLQTTPSRDSNFSVLILYVVVGSLSILSTGGIVKWKMGEVHQAEETADKDLERLGSNDDDDNDNDNGDDDQYDDDDDDDQVTVGNMDQDKVSDDAGETDHLLESSNNNNNGDGKKTRKPKQGRAPFSRKEVTHHESIAEALEEAARAHRDLAKLMNDAIEQSSARTHEPE